MAVTGQMGTTFISSARFALTVSSALPHGPQLAANAAAADRIQTEKLPGLNSVTSDHLGPVEHH